MEKAPWSMCTRVGSSEHLWSLLSTRVVFVHISGELHGPDKQREQKEVRKQKDLIYLAVKVVAPLCSLLLLIPCSLSKARGWQREDLHAKGHLNEKLPGFSLPDMQNQWGTS